MNRKSRFHYSDDSGPPVQASSNLEATEHRDDSKDGRRDRDASNSRGGEDDATVLCRGLRKRFESLEAVAGLDLRVDRGEIFGLVGPDGAGKTTTFRMLSGLLAPDDGWARVDGHPIEAGRRAGPALKDSIGYMPQRFGLYFDLSVEENMRFYADLFELEEKAWSERGRRLLEMTRLQEFLSRPAGKLSGGMKQKLGLTCALLHEPRVLLLDEPTNGVDPVSRREFWRILSELTGQNITVLMATAYLDEAERCDRVGLMYKGRLVACDRPDRLRRSLASPEDQELPSMEDTFIALVRQQDAQVEDGSDQNTAHSQQGAQGSQEPKPERPDLKQAGEDS
ncbi:MAG TPA: ABC transporter ATP-binding protein [Acidobacteriota bacterium]|nr:ABC transporter ATP-binding protein [Acidobacteriota bacterium]